jgi:hypothetical protein
VPDALQSPVCVNQPRRCAAHACGRDPKIGRSWSATCGGERPGFKPLYSHIYKVTKHPKNCGGCAGKYHRLHSKFCECLRSREVSPLFAGPDRRASDPTEAKGSVTV